MTRSIHYAKAEQSDKYFFNKWKHYFALFSIIKYLWVLGTSYSLIEVCSTEKLCTVPFKEISLWLSFLKSSNTLPKQKFFQLKLYFALNLQDFVLTINLTI